MRRRLFHALAAFAFAHAAAADDLFDDRPDSGTTIRDIKPFENLHRAILTQPAEALTADPTPREAPLAFGTKGTQYFTIGPGIANNFADAIDVNLRFAWSYFIVNNVEFSTELNAWYFNQPVEDSFGINPAFVFRWHFITRERWSLFTDAGIGLLFTTDDTPDGGTSFNFTPRVGGGFTYALDDEGTRLQVGLRWHHISNARIEGDSDNPARDGFVLYAGIMIPF